MYTKSKDVVGSVSKVFCKYFSYIDTLTTTVIYLIMKTKRRIIIAIAAITVKLLWLSNKVLMENIVLRYKLEPNIHSEDEFYLLVNGSLFVPYSRPPLLGTRDYCMETFWNESVPAGITLPVVCFATPMEDTKTSATLIAYATGLYLHLVIVL